MLNWVRLAPFNLPQCQMIVHFSWVLLSAWLSQRSAGWSLLASSNCLNVPDLPGYFVEPHWSAHNYDSPA